MIPDAFDVFSEFELKVSYTLPTFFKTFFFHLINVLIHKIQRARNQFIVEFIFIKYAFATDYVLAVTELD